MTGPYWPLTWVMFACNGLIPLVLLMKRVRTHLVALFVVSILVNVGMWLERYVIVVTSLARDFDPSNWTGVYQLTWVEGAITAGAFAMFFLLFLVFVKMFPPVSMSEIKAEMDAPADPAPAWAASR